MTRAHSLVVVAKVSMLKYYNGAARVTGAVRELRPMPAVSTVCVYNISGKKSRSVNIHQQILTRKSFLCVVVT